MNDNLRRHRAIKDHLLQLCPEANGHQKQHLLVLAALINGIVGSRHTNLPNIAAKVPTSTKRESQVKTFYRWLKNDHRAQDYRVVFAPFAQARTSSGSWSEENLDLMHVTGSDLDLRLSAASARLGALRVEDMAASVLVRPGEIEASIGRADFHDGSLKGRLSLVSSDGKTELKSQGTFSGVEIGPFLSSIGQSRWITGRAQGQFSFEGQGKNPVEVVQQAHGRPPNAVESLQLAQQATLETREAKHEPRSLAEQRKAWFAQAVDVLGGPGAVQLMVEQALNPAPLTAHETGIAWLDRAADRVLAAGS